MRILIVKLSSLGDVINTLPALRDAARYHPTLQADWVIEPAFAEIPRWHPRVRKIIPFALRQWRQRPWHYWHNGSWQQFYHALRAEHYDVVIDAQGLVKSGLITGLSRGQRCGYDRQSAWEPLACLAYQQKFAVPPAQHAIARIRQLFAHSLHYPLPDDFPDCEIIASQFPKPVIAEKYCVFLHGSARAEKCWPENAWATLINLTRDSGYRILLPWGNNQEKQRAEQLAHQHTQVTVLAKSTLTELAGILAGAQAIVAVDTGLGHLAAALHCPTISLYGPTLPEYNGTVGAQQQHIKVADLKQLAANTVWQQLQKIL